MLPMHTFDPSRACKVHDALNDYTFDWRPEWAAHYRAHAQALVTSGVVAWGGLLLDGWQELSPSIVAQ
jgi:hypothetical protein